MLILQDLKFDIKKVSRKSSFKNNLTKPLLALFIAFSLFWPIKFIQAIPLAPVLTGAEGAIGAAAGIPVVTTKSPIQKIFDFITEQIKEVSALAWKTAQLYFGTRLAQDAAVYLASGGKGQSSFIWNWSEVKKLWDGAAGEFLDDLSYSYFGKSACRPGDLNAQVQIDLNARKLISEAMDYVTAVIPNVCEKICARTAPGSETGKSKVTGVFGETADLFGQGMDASKVNKDLAKYDKAVDDLINSIFDSEEEMSRAIGKYIFEQVGYTLHGDKKTNNYGLVDYISVDGGWLEVLSLDDFYDILEVGRTFMVFKEGDLEQSQISLLGHGTLFKDLVKKILDMSGVDTLEEVAAVFDKQDMATFNQLSDANPAWAWDKRNVIDALGARYLVYGREFQGKDPGNPVSSKDDSIDIVRDFFTEAYFLFDEMKSAPAAAVDLDFLLNMLVSQTTRKPGLLYDVRVDLEDIVNTPPGIFLVLENSVKDPRRIESLIVAILDLQIFDQALSVIDLKDEIASTHGADLDELINAYQQFAQCVEACERGQIAEPYGVCTLSEIKKNEGIAGITGITGELGYRVDYGPFGAVDVSTSQQLLSMNAGENAEAQRARLGVGDLIDLSTIGDPANNPIGQVLQILEKSQKQSEQAKEQELAESQRAFASDKDLVSGTIKMPGSQVEGRLTNALADIRAANNAYTDSILAQMWGVFFNTLYKEFINNLYNKGFQPKLYGGPFNPETRQAYGTGIAAAQQQFGKLVQSQNITIGGAMNTEILSNLTSRCNEYTKCRFDQNIINTNFSQAIERQMTLAEAMDLKNNLISGSSIFGFKNAQGDQPDLDEGISYNSMIVLRKYRIIPSSWEAAAIWVRDVALKSDTKKQVTLQEVTREYKDPSSPYFGLVNPYWVLKLPLFQCKRQGAGEEIVSEMASPFSSYFTEEGDFAVQMSRMSNYCGDPQSCIREKTDGSGCESNGWGYCSRERDFWRFPTGRCDQIYKTCQAYTDPDNKSAAYLDQTLNFDECSDKSDGCHGYLRDFNWSRWSRLTGGVNPRLDGLSDNPFTFAPKSFTQEAVNNLAETFQPNDLLNDKEYDDFQRQWLPDPALYSQNIILNSIGLVKSMPTLWQCTDSGTGKFCLYERIAGRKEGCKLPSGAFCEPWKQVSLTKCTDAAGNECYYNPVSDPVCNTCDAKPEDNAKTVLGASSVNSVQLAKPESSQLYWCGLPGGAGCFVGQEKVSELNIFEIVEGQLKSRDLRTTDPPRHTTTEPGEQCVVGAWEYNRESGQYIFRAVANPQNTTSLYPLYCSLYRQGQDSAIGDKRVYLTGKAQGCSRTEAGCQKYIGMEFPSNEYFDSDGQLRFLTTDEKKKFTENLLEKGSEYLKDGLVYDDIPLLEIMPQSLKDIGANFKNEPTIVSKPLNLERQYCTEKDIDCRKYDPASGAEALAGILDPRKDLCPGPAQCVGYARYREPVTLIEKQLGTSVVITIDENQKKVIKYPDRIAALDRYFIAEREASCPAQYAGCEYFMYKPNDAPSAEDLYLTDLRLCVNTQYTAGEKATYTIIESAAKGATNPVNIELVKSNYKKAICYQINGKQVQVSTTDNDCTVGADSGQLYAKENYHAPCITMDPTKGSNKDQSNPDLWQCTDDNHFDEIQSALERCLTVKTVEDQTKQTVSNLAKAECREYIYFPEASGAERYALPNDLPIRVSNSCKAFKRGGFEATAIYNLDSKSEVLKNVRCDESAVSCREYLGAGSNITGKLSWVDFEDVEEWGERDEYGKIKENTKKPGKTANVNAVPEEALQFTRGTDYVYNILQQPLDPVNSEKVFRDETTDKVKSFKLSLWAQADAGTVIQIKLRDKNNDDIVDFQVDDVNHKPVPYTTSDGKWHYIVFNQVFLDTTVPHYLYVNSSKDFSLDSIVLEDSASIFRKQRDLAFSGIIYSIASHVETPCNTDFNREDKPLYDPNNPFPYQLSCQAYTTDNNQSISFKANTVSLCKDEVVGCEPLINTFNTANPAPDTYWPRAKDTPGKTDGYDDYFVPADAIEYVIANPSAKCNQIGCTLLGKEIKDPSGKVVGFEEKYLIDLPIQYQDPNQPIACLIKEQSCQVYKTKETGTVKRFKSPGIFACSYTRPSDADPMAWYKGGGDYKPELCESYNEVLDSSINKTVPRPKGYCAEKYTNRPVLNPETELTGWCEKPEDCGKFIENDSKAINKGIADVQCVPTAALCPAEQSTCTWFIDPLKTGEDRHYFHYAPNSTETDQACGSEVYDQKPNVSDDMGCRLFNDTEDGPLIYNAQKSWEIGYKNQDCNKEGYPACDANRLIKVKRDRACGEWLQCKSSLQTASNETVCLERQPCNSWGIDGECLNFVSDAKQSFTNKEIGASKDLFDKVSRLSGYSNIGYEWYQCSLSASPVVLVDKAGDLCINALECIDESRLYISVNCESGWDSQPVSASGACGADHVCQKGGRKGKECQINKDCYSIDELVVKDAEGCNQNVNQYCSSMSAVVVKPGFTSLDYINQTGAHAEIINGDFENVVFDVKEAALSSLIKKTYPTGWDTESNCNINNCSLSTRYDMDNLNKGRQTDVWRGKYSFKISGKHSIEQIIENIIPEATYTISGWINTGGGGSSEKQYDGIEVDELDANSDPLTGYNCVYFDEKRVNNPHCLITPATVGWKYFAKQITTSSNTRQLKIRLANNSGNTVIFDDIQVRAHLEISPTELVAPACRLYPGSDSLNCDARDNIGNIIRGWRGYCIEPDPRWEKMIQSTGDPRQTNQCVQWWPIDVIQGETNILGPIDEAGYLKDVPSPLYYCAETMDKDPGIPLPRLVCLAKNEVGGGEAYKYEACKIVALVSDPKPKFYGLEQGDWRLGVDANDIDDDHHKVRMVLGSREKEEKDIPDGSENFDASGLCVLNSDNRFIGKDGPPDCLNGCFTVQGLSGWENRDKNLGIPVFKQSQNSQKPAYGCVWSNNQGSNWEDCAKDLEQYYHKTAYFVFAQLNGYFDLDSSTAGCWPDDSGDRIYALMLTKAADQPGHKSTYPDVHPEVPYTDKMKSKYIAGNDEKGVDGQPDMWYYQSGRAGKDPVQNQTELNVLGGILGNPTPTRTYCSNNISKNCIKGSDCGAGAECLYKPGAEYYYKFDNFESVTRGRLNSQTWVHQKSAMGDDGLRLEKISEIAPRIGRPQQCSIIAQTVDVAGHNKGWFSKLKTGDVLPPPLGYNKTEPAMCIPFGAAPYLRTPNDIMLQPNAKDTGQPSGPKVTVPLELYHPENPENKDVGLLCKENYRGQGFYSCGGLCNVCVGGDRNGSFCMSDEECGSGTCGLQLFTAEKLGLVCAGQSSVEGQFIGKTIPAQYPYVSWTKPVACMSNKECQEGLMFSNPDAQEDWVKNGVCVGDKFPAESTMYCRASAPNDPLNQFCYQNGGECIKFYSCRDPKDIETPIIDDPEGKIYYRQSEPGISSKPESGLRRLQQIFAKIFKVWEWVMDKSKNAETLKTNTGVSTGYYREMQKSELDAKVGGEGQWSKARDIANLAVECANAGENQFCADFPGCAKIDFSGYACVPQVAGNYANYENRAGEYRDYDYCKKIEKEGDCIAQSLQCKWRSETAMSCIPYQNQYPDITAIKINGKENENVVLREDNRTVSLEMRVSANKNQLPITMVWIDWGDGSKTGLSGIAWDAASSDTDKQRPEGGVARTFNHTYAYYPEQTSSKPLSCKDYDPDPVAVKYECRFRPRIKVVDNWGWCNGQKIENKGNNLNQADILIPSDPGLTFKSGDGYAWGYYGADCFKPECKKDETCSQPEDSDSRYGMQSWDYFTGYINILPGEEKDEEEKDKTPPEIKLSFFDINGQRQITQAKLFDSILLNLECKDELSPIVECSVSQGQSPYIDCLPTLNNKAKECKTTSCSVWAECRFTTGVGEWQPTLTAIDEKGNSGSADQKTTFTVLKATY